MVEAEAKQSWASRQLSKNVFEVRVQARLIKDWTFRCLVTGDRHWDNPDSNHKLQQEHLEEAKAIGAPVIDIGDFLCLMQGKYDPRSSKSKVRPEHNTDNHLGDVVSSAVDFFSDYKDELVVIGVGNHEASVSKRIELSITDLLVDGLRANGSNVYNGQFSGFVLFRFQDGKSVRQVTMHYDHGYGGGSPVTADMPSHARRQAFLPDADIIVSGHTHDAWARKIARKRVNGAGKVYLDEQLHIKVPTYKDEYKDGSGGWHVETGKPPKPVGAYWVEFVCRENRTITYKAIEA